MSHTHAQGEKALAYFSIHFSIHSPFILISALSFPNAFGPPSMHTCKQPCKKVSFILELLDLLLTYLSFDDLKRVS